MSLISYGIGCQAPPGFKSRKGRFPPPTYQKKKKIPLILAVAEVTKHVEEATKRRKILEDFWMLSKKIESRWKPYKAEKCRTGYQGEGHEITHEQFTEQCTDFVFGLAGAAYQIEGGAKEGGRGPSIWDTATYLHPEKITDHSNGNVAADSYHLYKEDVKLLKTIGADSYRFSISWSRILPYGKLSGGINREGIEYYNNLIDELLANGIKPFVTLFHFDLPQALEDEYGGFLSPNIVEDFCDYAQLCFWEFGDRVHHWTTFNETYTYCFNGYATAWVAPFRGTPAESDEGEEFTSLTDEQINQTIEATSREADDIERTLKLIKHLYEKANKPDNNNQPTKGDPGIEPYKAAKNMLLAHAAAVDLYRKHFQPSQSGKIGITLVTNWFEPLDSKKDKDHRDRALDFQIGWFLKPLTTGDYPQSMKDIVGPRFKEGKHNEFEFEFKEEEKKLLAGSFDFIGAQYYTTQFVKKGKSGGKHDAKTDSGVTCLNVDENGKPIGALSGSSWLHICPKGIYDVLKYIRNCYSEEALMRGQQDKDKKVFGVKDIYITENGVSEINDQSIPLSKALNDESRIAYHKEHLFWVHKAMEEDVPVKGYYVWSLLDNFEWYDGYRVRFGMVYVDYKDGCRRYPKSSAKWFRDFLKGKKKDGKEDTPAPSEANSNGGMAQ